jgi:hypothetical protein
VAAWAAQNQHSSQSRRICWCVLRWCLEIAKHLYGMGVVGVHAEDDRPFKAACWGSKWEVAEWLTRMGIPGHVWPAEHFRVFRKAWWTGAPRAVWMFAMGNQPL